MKTLRLRADTEAALIDALPMLRTVDADGAPCWLTAGPVCDVDPIGPLTLTAPVVDPETGEVMEPAVVDERWHANLRGPRIGAAPAEWEAIVSAAEPFTLSDIANPRRRFQA
ncbi:hypothetical protein TSH7_01205 [Azospirillum sp. TSH7]|uniref:hypothetical protein n=1 Tax=unclassified Azospirillum TaxID=2630922 RepID=UPI000D6206F9|nr:MULTISPECIES: hypothetical protein [unclassified Azospirillum]PWC69092.1 hypothetical protein TSH7_01205 [Azospirillum sp. TSH7]PWC71416.1 hypothetical protein TSH20_03870 [Azospirillum sp. TSH20]